jgi:hypothetical protein
MVIASESRTLEEKRDWALAGKERWEAKLEQADAKESRAHEMGGGIPGFGWSGNQRAAKQVRSAFSSADRAWREATEKLEYYTGKLRSYERRIAERNRKRLDHEDIVGAVAVKTSTGWRRVVRVNAKSVSVTSGYSWVDRIQFGQILEVRKA